MLTPVLVLFLVSALAPMAQRALGKRAGVVLATAPALLFAHFARFLGPSGAVQAVEESWPWVAGMGIHLAFRLDGLSLLFALLVTGIGALVLVYGGEYVKGDPRLGRFYSATLFFMAAMLALITSTCDTFEDIQQFFGALNWGEIQTIGYRFTIRNIKIRTNLS